MKLPASKDIDYLLYNRFVWRAWRFVAAIVRYFDETSRYSITHILLGEAGVGKQQSWGITATTLLSIVINSFLSRNPPLRVWPYLLPYLLLGLSFKRGLSAYMRKVSLDSCLEIGWIRWGLQFREMLKSYCFIYRTKFHTPVGGGVSQGLESIVLFKAAF